MKQIDAKDALLIDDNNPRIETYRERFTSETVRYWFGDSPINASDKYRIYVPKGAIKREFSVDLR